MEGTTLFSEVVFINLFLTPMITLYILYKCRKKTPQFNATLLLQYVISLVTNSILMKFIAVLLRKIISYELTFYSSYYTLIASVIAIILPIMYYVLGKNFGVSITVDENSTVKEELEDNEKKDD